MRKRAWGGFIRPRIKNIITGSLLSFLTFCAGLMLTRPWVAKDSGTVNTANALDVWRVSIAEETLPERWKKLEVKNKVTMRMPHDMKPTSPLGDSYSYREAYSNGQIDLIIIYGEAIVPLRDDQSHFLLPSCDMPRGPDIATYQKSFIEIDGRKAQLRIDLSHKEELISTSVCFNKTADNEAALRVIAYCEDERALKIAQQIFTSIKFKDSASHF